MFVLVEKLILNAVKLPAAWQRQLPRLCARELNIPPAAVAGVEILSCSVDSRKGTPKLQLNIIAELTGNYPRLHALTPEELAGFAPPEPEIPDNPGLKNPIVVGTGPAGISAAYILALAGCEPVILDRGQKVETRAADYTEFLQSRRLNTESNLLIGEGGAGTFSDGKLHTGTKDKLARFFKKLWVECGAPEEILWRARPHIGSDMLIPMTARLREKIESMGGIFRFNCHVDDILVESSRCTGVKLASGERLTAPAVIFAPGLGGRELVRNVMKHVAWEFKMFQSGCRIEHPQSVIDRAMYHLPQRPESLGAAEYHIVSRSQMGNVSSFCMCPGGTVVNATAWENRSITNGMSCFARDGKFANSCLITTLDPADFGNMKEFYDRFDRLEREIFDFGGKDYTLPAQDAAAFIRGMNGLDNAVSGSDTGIVAARLDQLVPGRVKNALTAAVRYFDRNIPGFIKTGKFIGAESFVSSPVRLCRDRERMENPELSNFYPAGEGCGLAGGIVSAACDGARSALALLRNKK